MNGGSNRSGYQLYVVANDGGAAAQGTHFEYDVDAGAGGIGDVAVHRDLMPANVWRHYAFVHENGLITLYVDGTASPTVSTVGSIVPRSAIFSLAGTAAGGNSFPGAFDEIAVYDRALGFGEITAHKVAGRL